MTSPQVKRPRFGPTLINADDELYRPGRWLTILVGFGLLTLGLDYFKYPELYEPGTALFSDQAAMFQVARGGFSTVFRPDFNYLHPLPRLIASIAEFLGVREGEAGTFYQVVGSFIRGMLIGVITLSVFRVIVPTDALRWLIALILATIGDHNMRFMYNIGYLQIVFVTLTASLALVARGRQVTALLSAACALALTKIMMAVTLPIQLGAAVRQAGAARWITIGMVLLVLVNVGVALAIDRANPDLDNWLSNPEIEWRDRISLGLALPGLLISRWSGLEGLLGAGSFLAALAGYAIALISLSALVLQRRWSTAVFYSAILAVAVAYSLVSSALVTRFLNWTTVAQSASEHGQLMYHAFPVLAFALFLLIAGIDAIVRLCMSSFRREPSTSLAGLAAAIVGALLLASPWTRSMHEPHQLFRLEASADMWSSAWRSVEHPEGRLFCVPTPYTFHAPYPRGTCELLYRSPIESRLVWSHQAGPDNPLVLTLEIPPGARVMGIAINARTIGAYDETVQFTITSGGAPIDGVGPLYREVYGSGRMIMVPFDTPLAGLQTIEIHPERPLLFLADERSGQDYYLVVGAP